MRPQTRVSLIIIKALTHTHFEVLTAVDVVAVPSLALNKNLMKKSPTV